MKVRGVILFLATFAVFSPNRGDAAEVSPEVKVVLGQLEAYNRHSAEEVVAFYAEDIKWRSIDGDTVSIEGAGRESIRTWLAGYFKSFPNVKSELLEINQTGPYVVFRERPSWTGKNGQPRSQVAIGIFEVRDGLVRRAWYYPAVKDTPPVTK